MYTTATESPRLYRTVTLTAAAALDAVSVASGRAALALRSRCVARVRRDLAAERPRDRLGPRDAVLLRHPIPDSVRIK